jgi:hypothetical protein
LQIIVGRVTYNLTNNQINKTMQLNQDIIVDYYHHSNASNGRPIYPVDVSSSKNKPAKKPTIKLDLIRNIKKDQR